MTARFDSRFLGCVLAAALGCTAPDRSAPGTSQVLLLTLTAQTPAALPPCTGALRGTTAATESPAGIWSCQGNAWAPIPCTNGLAGAVAYASATKSLWACTAGQWVNVVLPAGAQGARGETGATGAEGKTGATSIVAQTVEPPGANCPNGGTRIASWLDLDGDQRLGDGENAQVTYVCNGATGPAGDDGAPGAPGALLTVTPEPAGANCPGGGQRIDAGVDTNRNGMLDAREITTVSFVCNGGMVPPLPPDGGTGGGGTLTVSCTSPTPDGFVQAAPGTTITVSGTVIGGSGATTLNVNGVATALAADGAFTAPITTRYGLNHVVLDAADGAGNLRHGLCSFLVADQFVDEGAPLANGVVLRLAQSALDDGARTGPIDSLADALATALDSEGLQTAVHDGLLAANPLYDEGPTEVRYLSSSLAGPNTVSASLVGGGIAAHVRFEHPVVHLRVTRTDLGLPVHTSGDASAEFVEVDATFDVALDAAGQPHAAVRPGSAAVRVGTIDTNFDGLLGFILNVAVNTANSFAQADLANMLRDTATATLNSALDGIVSNLDVAGLPATFAVPRFDGTGNTMLTFTSGFSTVDTSAARMLVGASSGFAAPAAHSRPPNRVPLPAGAPLVDPDGTQPVAVATHVGVLQQALQANWRGGGLDGTVTAATGAHVTFTTKLPPVVFIKDDGSLAIDLCVDARASLPGAATPIQARVVVRAGGRAALSGDDLLFSAVKLDEAHVVTPEVDLSAADASTLRDTLTGLLVQMAERSLNDLLPGLPVPAFTIPAALSVYDLPADTTLGIVGAMLTLDEQRAVLRGGFGAR